MNNIHLLGLSIIKTKKLKRGIIYPFIPFLISLVICMGAFIIGGIICLLIN